MTEGLIGQLGYLGIVLLLVLGGLGLPVPEEAPIILAAILSKKHTMWWPLALGSCFVGVLAGDFVVYFLGFFYGEKVLSLPLARKFLTRAREAQIKGYFHRHGIKILILGRFAVGFRTAAYLTAGILRLPMLKLFLTDLLAASFSTLLMFGLAWRFAELIEASLREAKHWAFLVGFCVLVAILVYRYYRGRHRAGMPVGPPVLVGDDVALPRDDLRSSGAGTSTVSDKAPKPTPPLSPAPAIVEPHQPARKATFEPQSADTPSLMEVAAFELELVELQALMKTPTPERESSDPPKPAAPFAADGNSQAGNGVETPPRKTPERRP